MPAEEGFTLGPRAIAQIRRLVWAEATKVVQSVAPVRGRWQRGGGCNTQNCKLQIHVFGGPTGGTFDFDLTVNGVEETLTLNYDDTATEVKTELETHSEIAVDDVIVTDGPLPSATIEIEFVKNLANTDIGVPTTDWSSLTGGSGVAVLFSKTQLGYPKS